MIDKTEMKLLEALSKVGAEGEKTVMKWHDGMLYGVQSDGSCVHVVLIGRGSDEVHDVLLFPEIFKEVKKAMSDCKKNRHE